MTKRPALEWFVTFGQRYRREEHPALEEAHPDGWVVIEATDAIRAHRIAIYELGELWCDIYTPATFQPGYFPRGELARYDEHGRKLS